MHEVKDRKRISRDEHNRKEFTVKMVERLRPPPKGQQLLVWDTGQRGLALLVSSGGTKTFRSQYKLNGKWETRTIKRLGELASDEDLAKEYGPDIVEGMTAKKRADAKMGLELRMARAIVANDRIIAEAGTDPKQQNPSPTARGTYEAVVNRFIEEYAKPRQRTWKQTEAVLKRNCEPWLKRQFASITKHDAKRLLMGFRTEGHEAKAKLTYAWLKTLWSWAYKEDLVAGPVMDAVNIEFEAKAERERVYSDDEIKAIWKAAEQLKPKAPEEPETAEQQEARKQKLRQAQIEEVYIKLLVLLAPRKSALAGMRVAHLDDAKDPTLWTTPHELTKSKKKAKRKREYLTPLPPWAQRILKPLLPKKGATTDLMFPGKDGPLTIGSKLKNKLVKHGAPADFSYHAVRHTLATWLKGEGHDTFDRALVLNHAEAGVTAGYSRGGYALERKRELLSKWADHIERLVTAEGENVKALR